MAADVGKAADVGLTISQRPWLRAVTLCSLYFAQGLPYGFASIAVAAAMANHGATPDAIAGLMATILLPWTFKWAWGPLIDRFNGSAMGRRRPWILFAQSLMVLGVLSIVFGPDPLEHQAWLLWSLLFVNIGCSLQDVSVDALAVDQLKEDERGRINGFMWGSNYVGLAAGGAVLGTIAARTDLRDAAFVLAVSIGAIMLLPLLVRERPGERRFPWSRGAAHPTSLALRGSAMLVITRLFRAFSLRSTLVGALLALGLMTSVGLLGACSSVLLIQDLGWAQDDYSFWTGNIAFVGLAGSICGGLAADRFGPRRIAALGGLGVGVCLIVFACATGQWSNQTFVIVYMGAESFCSGVMTVACFSMFMTLSWPLVAATQFTAYMAMFNISRLIGTALVPAIVPESPTVEQWSNVWLIAAALQVVPLVFLLWIDPKQTRRVLGGAED
jgi:PAT family beta-lactamase induction signal transducer AmpG